MAECGPAPLSWCGGAGPASGPGAARSPAVPIATCGTLAPGDAVVSPRALSAAGWWLQVVCFVR